MTRRMILHVGHGKTGTSTIQSTMFVNGDLLRERCSVNYPGFAANHWLFAAAFLSPGEYPAIDQLLENDPRPPEERRHAAANVIDRLRSDAGRYQTHVLSSELFFHLGSEPLRRFKALFDELGFDTTVLIYVRNPTELVSSIMNQRVKAGRETLTSIDHIDLFVEDRVRRYISVFGRERLRVRVFGRTHFVNGDLIDDFLATVTDTPVEGLRRVRPVNPSLSLPALRIADALNRLAPPRSPERGPDSYLAQIAGPEFKAPRRIVQVSLDAQADSIRFLAEEFGITFPEIDLSAFPEGISRTFSDETVASLASLLNKQSLRIGELTTKVRRLTRKRERSARGILRRFLVRT